MTRNVQNMGEEMKRKITKIVVKATQQKVKEQTVIKLSDNARDAN